MKYLFTLCLLVFSLSASAQWQQTGAMVRYVNGLGIPTRDTAAGVAADSSQILIRPADSSLYIKYKRTWVKVGSGGTIGGSGTTNRVSKFTGATTLGNSSIVDSASAVAMTINPSGNIGIGITNPSVRFHVLVPGNEMRIESNTSSDGFIRYINTSGSMSFGMSGAPTNTMLLYDRTNNHNAYEYLGGASGRHVWYTANAERMRITSAGNALIGTSTDNGVDKLQVNGGLNVSARATAQNLSVTNNISVTNDINQGSGTANANWTILANGTSSGWAGRMVGRYSSGIFLFQHRNNSSTFVDCFYVDGNGGIGNTVFLDRAYISPGQAATGVLVVNSNTWSGNDELEVNGSISGIGMKQGYVTKTGAYTATNDDYVIDCTSGTFTVTLPASSGRTGRILIIKNSGTGTITVDGNGSETIDGATTYSLSAQWATVQLMCDGTNWKIISKF